MQNNRVFCNFVKSKLQNHPFSLLFWSVQQKAVPLHRLWRFVSFFSIAFAIYGVKLLLTHLAEIARWVLFFIIYLHICAKSSTFVAAIWFFIFVKYTHLAEIARWVLFLREKFPIKRNVFIYKYKSGQNTRFLD